MIVARRFTVVRESVSTLRAVIGEAVTGIGVVRSTGTEERTRTALDTAVEHTALEEIFASLGLRPWIEALPDRFDTRVGMRGDRLSAGERQLVALARTALVDPDLLVLDEATSGVDPATDVRVQRALGALTVGRTTVSIAHRMVTAEQADRVLVFDRGQVVQNGRHDDLLRQPGRYAELHAAWAAHTCAGDSSRDTGRRTRLYQNDGSAP